MVTESSLEDPDVNLAAIANVASVEFGYADSVEKEASKYDPQQFDGMVICFNSELGSRVYVVYLRQYVCLEAWASQIDSIVTSILEGCASFHEFHFYLVKRMELEQCTERQA